MAEIRYVRIPNSLIVRSFDLDHPEDAEAYDYAVDSMWNEGCDDITSDILTIAHLDALQKKTAECDYCGECETCVEYLMTSYVEGEEIYPFGPGQAYTIEAYKRKNKPVEVIPDLPF